MLFIHLLPLKWRLCGPTTITTKIWMSQWIKKLYFIIRPKNQFLILSTYFCHYCYCTFSCVFFRWLYFPSKHMFKAFKLILNVNVEGKCVHIIPYSSVKGNDKLSDMIWTWPQCEQKSYPVQFRNTTESYMV